MTSTASARPETIVALSSGQLPAAVAVLRISGPRTRFVFETIAGPLPPDRTVVYRAFRDPATEAVLDRGLAFWFAAPRSFTGEDAAEFQTHGSRAVVAALLGAILRLPGVRMAEPGEFTRRALQNGRLDLTAAEGLADLIGAETEAQRRQALAQAEGSLFRKAEGWRKRLIGIRGLVEAVLDFPDEDGIDDGLLDELRDDIASLLAEFRSVLADSGRGARIREGFAVVILGPPNAGKSTLLNRIARRDVAIVTPVPGTTRDVLEVSLDLGGLAVRLLDTAGVRESDDLVEQEGIRRALVQAGSADLVLWLDPEGRPPGPDQLPDHHSEVWVIRSKADQAGASGQARFSISAETDLGINMLLQAMTSHLTERAGGEPGLVVNQRQAGAVAEAADALDAALQETRDLEILAEMLRASSAALDGLVGRTDVEEILGSIFSRFCMGK